MPKNLIIKKHDADNVKLNSYTEPTPSVYYSLSKEKENNEKQLIELERQLNLAIKLLTKVTDSHQRSKLETKKKNCIEEKQVLETIINEIKNTYVFFYKSQRIYPFVEEFYNLFVQLFDKDHELDSSFIKNLEKLRNKERELIESLDCALDPNVVLSIFYEYDDVEKFTDSFFDKIQAECIDDSRNYFFNYILFCEKLSEIYNKLLGTLGNNVFNIKSLRIFFQGQAVNFPLPSTNHSLVGLVAILIYKTLFNFLKRQPISTNFKKLTVYIKFHVAISNASKNKFILHELSTKQKKIKALNEKLIELHKANEEVSGSIDESIKNVELACQELSFIEHFQNTFFKNKFYIYLLNVLNSVLQKSKTELSLFMQERSGLKTPLFSVKKNIYSLKSNKMFINYFFSSICSPVSREELRKTVTYIIMDANQIESELSVDLMSLTNKTLLDLSYLVYSFDMYFELDSDIDVLKENVINLKLSSLNVSFELSINMLDTHIEKIEQNEKFFLEKKFIGETLFLEHKKSLLDDFEIFLCVIKRLISQAEELNSLVLSHQSSCMAKLCNYYLIKILYLKNLMSEHLLRCDKIKNRSLSDEFTISTPVKNLRPEKFKLAAKDKLINLDRLFEPITWIAKDLLIVANCIEQQERTITKYNKNQRKRNRFSSALGRIRASTNLIDQAFYEFASVRMLRPSLLEILEAVRREITHDNHIGFNLFEKNMNTCFLLIERIQQEIIAVTFECEAYNNELAELLEKTVFASSNTSILFRDNAIIKKPDIILNEKSTIFFQKLDWLKKIINIIGCNEGCVRKFYSVISRAEEYERLYNCIRQQHNILASYSLPSSIEVDKNKQLLEANNCKVDAKNKIKNVKGKKAPICSDHTSSRSSFCGELEKINKWSLDFEDWKQKRYSYLDSFFNTIEKCSFANLNNTANVFLKILDYYNKEICHKQVELNAKLAEVETLTNFQVYVEPLKNFMIYSDHWLSNVLARLKQCNQYLLEFCEKFNFHVGNGIVGNTRGAPNFPDQQVVNDLLADYLKYFLICDKKKNKLLLEEKNLTFIKKEFIIKMLQKSSLSEIEKEADLLSRFNEKLTEVNVLTSAVKEAQAKRQIVKEELSRLVDPDSLNFYLRRIDPGDTPVLTNSVNQLPIPENYVMIPSSFYSVKAGASNISLIASTHYESNPAYFSASWY